MRKAIGYLILFLLFASLFVMTCLAEGIKTAAIIWGVIVLLAALSAIAAWLIV